MFLLPSSEHEHELWGNKGAVSGVSRRDPAPAPALVTGPGFSKLKRIGEEENIYSIAALSRHFDKFTGIKLLIYNSSFFSFSYPGNIYFIPKFLLSVVAVSALHNTEMNTSKQRRQKACENFPNKC